VRSLTCHQECGECKTAVSGEEIDLFTGESTHTVCVRVALANMGLDISAIGKGVHFFAITENGIVGLAIHLLMNPELQEALRSTGGVIVGVLASCLGDPVARAKAGAPFSVTVKWLRSKGVKVYCRRVPEGHEDLSTPQRSPASLQGATPAEERARAATAAAEMDGGTPSTPATPVATLFGKTPPASNQGLPSVAEVEEEAEVVVEMGVEDTLPAPDHTPRAQKRAGELAKHTKKTEKGKEPEQNSSDDEPPDDSGGDGDDVGNVEDGEGARLRKPSGDERRAGRSRRPKASKNEGAGRGRDKDRGKGKEQKQGKKPSKSGEQKKKL